MKQIVEMDMRSQERNVMMAVRLMAMDALKIVKKNLVGYANIHMQEKRLVVQHNVEIVL